MKMKSWRGLIVTVWVLVGAWVGADTRAYFPNTQNTAENNEHAVVTERAVEPPYTQLPSVAQTESSVSLSLHKPTAADVSARNRAVRQSIQEHPDEEEVFREVAAKIKQLASENQTSPISLIRRVVTLLCNHFVPYSNKDKLSDVNKDIRTVMSNAKCEAGIFTDKETGDVLYMNTIELNSEDNPIVAVSFNRQTNLDSVTPRLYRAHEAGDAFNNRYEFSFKLDNLDAYEKYSFMIYPKNKYLRAMPPPYCIEAQVIDLVLTPRDWNETVNRSNAVTSTFFDLTKIHLDGFPCYYWNNEVGDWSDDLCFVSKDGCQCILKGELIYGGQIVSCRYSNVRDSNYNGGFEDEDSDSDISLRCNELAEYVNIENIPVVTSTIEYKSILDGTKFIENLKHLDHGTQINLQQFIKKSVAVFSNIQEGVDDDVLEYQYDLYDALLQCITVSMKKNQLNPLVAVAFNGYPPKLIRGITSIEYKSVQHFFKTGDTFGIIIDESIVKYASQYTFLLYPVDKSHWPEPSLRNFTFNCRVGQVGFKPRDNMTGLKTFLIDFYYKPSPRQFNVSTGCAIWSDARGNWSDDECQFDNLAPNMCRCQMTVSLEDKYSLGAFVVYQYVDNIHFNFYDDNKALSVDEKITLYDLCFHDYSDITSSLFPFWYALGYLNMNEPNITINQWQNSTSTFGLHLVQDLELIMSGTYIISENTYSSVNYHYLGFSFQSIGPITSNNSLNIYSFRDPQKTTGITPESLNVEDKLSADVDLVLTISNYILQSIQRTMILIYPIALSLTPTVTLANNTIFNNQIIHLILEPEQNISKKENQSIDMYFRSWTQRFEDVKIGCASWNFQQNVWIHEGCWSLSPDGCRCSLAPNDGLTLGRQFAIFEYKYINESMQKRLERFRHDDGPSLSGFTDLEYVLETFSILKYYTETPVLIHYATDIVFHLNHILALEEAFLHSQSDLLSNILDCIDVILFRLGKEYPFAMRKKPWTWRQNPYEVSMLKSVLSNNVSTERMNEHRWLTSEMQIYCLYNAEYELENQLSVRLFPPSRHEFDVPAFQTQLGSESYYRQTKFSVMVMTRKMKFRVFVMIYPINRSLLPTVVYNHHTIYFSRVVDLYFTPRQSWVEENDGDDQEKYVDIMFQPLNSDNLSPSSSLSSVHLKSGCAHWSNRSWSTSGCWIVNNGSYETCRCNLSEHLQESCTNVRYVMFLFADKENFQLKEEYTIKEIIFLIGSVLSLFGFLLIILTASIFRSYRNRKSNKILLHLTASSLFYLVLTIYRETHYIYSVVSGKSNASFITFTAIVHYSRLSHYFWMLVMSVLQLKRLLTMVGPTYVSNLLLKVSLFAWGTPLVPLIVLLSWKPTEHFCGPNLATHLALYFIPGAVITLLNMVVLSVILARICACFGWGEKADLRRHVSNRKLLLRRLKTIVLLFFLFGIPTAFEMFNDLGDHVSGLEYLYKMTDPMQGFVLFLFFVVFDEKARECWRDWIVDWTGIAKRPGQDLVVQVVVNQKASPDSIPLDEVSERNGLEIT